MTRFCHKQELKQEKKAKSNFPEHNDTEKKEKTLKRKHFKVKSWRRRRDLNYGVQLVLKCKKL